MKMHSLLSYSKETLLQWTVDGCSRDEEPLREESVMATVVSSKGIPALTCQLCRIGIENGTPKFENVSEQRAHFKTDWHRYNLHLSLKQRPVVGRVQFERKIENEEVREFAVDGLYLCVKVSSISGSASESEDEDSDHRDVMMTGMVHVTSQDGKPFRVWQCLLSPQKSNTDTDLLTGAIDRLAALQQWAVILAKGGHFAAACFQKSVDKGQGHYYSITQHKTLHRYVIRAKAGGRQSIKDATGKHAKSAGASLRRYNEAALERDIVDILTSWKTELIQCDVILTAVSANDARALFGGDRPPLDHRDKRIRRIPFPTRRPTFSETKRVTQTIFTIYERPQAKTEADPLTSVKDDVTADNVNEEPLSKTGQASIEVSRDTSACPLSSIHEPTEDTLTLDEPDLNTVSVSKSKKKSRRRQKGKDRRRKETMEFTEDVSDEPKQEEKPDDEVERAIAEAAAQMKRMQQRKTSTKKPVTKTQSVEERRELMRVAAEKRLADLQSTARKQQLW